jgi:UDP-N-acetylglucosamine diphosphorylase / glucose-1-phosphate thymidylyltransferase / UDP-N-acetylgalactosamine diphosphorylase / glucosamine-1-phosphate N-acetyltransferase / galactosamine-1-phosphate N-acetyltransferase
MRLIIFDGPSDRRAKFQPLSFSRPVWELRCGMKSLGERLVDKFRPAEVACFTAQYLAGAYRESSGRRVNDAGTLGGEDLFAVHASVKADSLAVPPQGPPEVGVDAGGDVMYIRLPREKRLQARFREADSRGDARFDDDACFSAFLAAAKAELPNVPCPASTWNYAWELVMANPAMLSADFRAAGRAGIDGSAEQPFAMRGDAKDVYVARGAKVHPMVVIDAEHGPVYVDEGAEIHPFTRIEGPCYIGPDCILLGAKCREGNSIGPMCRIGGEVEESIIQGWTNKYHDGFIGHAYVGEWVNLGAGTTSSDLKNDYSNVAVCLDGRSRIDTGLMKVGCLIGDHTKTSIGTLFNTGTCVGAMSMVLAHGGLLPKFVPSFAWAQDGKVVEGRGGKGRLCEIARRALARRQREWTPAMESMWNAIYELTAGHRQAAMMP